MKAVTVRIRDFRVRVPGLTQEQALRLGEAVLQRLSGSPFRSKTLLSPGAVNVRVQAAQGASIQGLADEIVRRIHSEVELERQ